MDKKVNKKQSGASNQSAKPKFKIGDKVKINISELELNDCNKDFEVWLKENNYEGVIDDIAKDVKYPYYIEGHDFLESELTLIEKEEN